MAFGYKYWMVYLPDKNPNSFLLFVHNPAGSTKLRDYSSGREVVLGQPRDSVVLTETEEGRTRFRMDPHATTDVAYWHMRTLEHNGRYGLQSKMIPGNGAAPIKQCSPNRAIGRAVRGSRRQLQDYVNDHPEILSTAVLDVLPPRLRELGAHIRWVSPIAQEDYAEYRDEDFLRAVRFEDAIPALKKFWPMGGPSWDALGIVHDDQGRLRRGVVLVEAKSHLQEIYGNGCQAAGASRTQIENALSETKRWCGADPAANWLGPLYQSANRLAHLYFFREILKEFGRPTWLVNLCFVDDPIGPATRYEWERELCNVKSSLGLHRAVPHALEVFLPALGSSLEPEREIGPKHDDFEPSRDEGASSASGVPNRETAGSAPFKLWASEWMSQATYCGTLIPDPMRRIQDLVALWSREVPGNWRRGEDTQLMGVRYRRGDINNPHAGEHAIEHQILIQRFEAAQVLGCNLVDGVNALPLVGDERGGRSGNVEADLYLLAHCADGYRLFLCEVKSAANNPWYAAVENLRQLRLLREAGSALRLFHRRRPDLHLPDTMAVTGLVIAPLEFYTSPGQKAQALPATRQLLRSFRDRFGVEVLLCAWDASCSSVHEIERARERHDECSE